LILGNNGVKVHGSIQDDFTGFTLNDFLFIQSREFQGNFAILAFDVPNGTFHKIQMDQEKLFILGACHIIFELENLVLKIGGYRGRHLFNFDERPIEQPAFNTTSVLKFSKPLLEFSTMADLKVSKKYKSLIKLWVKYFFQFILIF
jgi:hypothetical protein